MKVKLTDLHPTQLYLSEKKLHDIQMLDQSAEIINMDPISILTFGNRFLITDGHHRAYQALLAGQDEYEAKWYNWCDGFNQAATLLLKRNADETDQANR